MAEPTAVTVTWTEWGIRYGDGDIDGYDRFEQDARKDLAEAHERVAVKGDEWESYEGATLICRRVTTTCTEWEPSP